MSAAPENQADGDEAKEEIQPVAKDEIVTAQPDSTEIQKAPKQGNSSLDGIIDYLPAEPVKDPPKGWTRYVPSIGLCLIAGGLIIHGELNRPVPPPEPPKTGGEEDKMSLEKRLQLAKQFYKEAEKLYEEAQGFWNDDEHKIRRAYNRCLEAERAIHNGNHESLGSAFRVLLDDIEELKAKCKEDLEWDL